MDAHELSKLAVQIRPVWERAKAEKEAIRRELLKYVRRSKTANQLAWGVIREKYTDCGNQFTLAARELMQQAPIEYAEKRGRPHQATARHSPSVVNTLSHPPARENDTGRTLTVVNPDDAGCADGDVKS